MPPQEPPTEYHDSLFDRLFIRLFSHKMAKAVGQTTPQPGYDGFVDLSQKIMKGRKAQEQQALVAVVLRSLVPSPVLWLIRTLVSPTRLVCELNAWFATVLFEWLVGPCEVKEVTVTDADGQPRLQNSGVHIKNAAIWNRVAVSACVSTCANCPPSASLPKTLAFPSR